MTWICNREWPVRRNEYAHKLTKNGTDEAIEQIPAFYNEKSLEFLTAKKLADGRCWKFRWFLDENELMSKTINPWLKGAYRHKDLHEEKIPAGVWGLIACERGNGAMNPSVLLDFMELDFDDFPEIAKNFDGIMKFTEWVAHFNPKTWGDWLMVPKLFKLYLRSRQNLPALAATPDPWLDAVLRESHGILMWTHQLIQIIRMIADVGIHGSHKDYDIRLNEEIWLGEIIRKHPSAHQTIAAANIRGANCRDAMSW